MRKRRLGLNWAWLSKAMPSPFRAQAHTFYQSRRIKKVQSYFWAQVWYEL